MTDTQSDYWREIKCYKCDKVIAYTSADYLKDQDDEDPYDTIICITCRSKLT